MTRAGSSSRSRAATAPAGTEGWRAPARAAGVGPCRPPPGPAPRAERAAATCCGFGCDSWRPSAWCCLGLLPQGGPEAGIRRCPSATPAFQPLTAGRPGDRHDSGSPESLGDEQHHEVWGAAQLKPPGCQPVRRRNGSIRTVVCRPADMRAWQGWNVRVTAGATL